MKMMTVQKLAQQTVVLAAWFKREICRALEVYVNRTFMSPDSTNNLQWPDFKTKHPKLIANRVCKFFKRTSVDECIHFASIDNLADAATRAMFAEVLQSSI